MAIMGDNSSGSSNAVAHNCHGKTKTSRQKQKHHGKTKNLTAKTKYLAAKTKTSRQNQMLHSKSKIALIGFAVGIGFGHEVFAWFLLCIWFCREVFGFAVRFLVLSWAILFLPWGFWFCRESCGPPYRLYLKAYYRGEYQISISPAILQRWSETIWSTSTPLQPRFWLFIPWLGAFL